MENKSHNTKSIVEAGLISAIIVVLMLITGYVPIISFVGTLILPIPVAVLYIRHNIKITITAVVVSTIITAMLFNPIQALLSAVSFGLTGLVFGYSIKKEKSSNFTLLVLTIASLVATIFSYVLTIVIVQKTTFTAFFTTTVNQINDMMKESVSMAKGFYGKAGMTQDQLSQLDAMFNLLNADFLINAFAALMLIQAFMSAFIDYIVAKSILKKLGYQMQKLTPFSEIYINSFIGALVVMPVPLGVYLNAKNIPVGKVILTSGQLIMTSVFLVIGISVAVYFLKNKFKLSNGVITLIAVFTALNPLFSTILIYLGLVDMIFDFRKINPDRILNKQ